MLNFSKKVEIHKDVDIFIAGGGPSGIAAAVTASRNGAKVFLVESHTCFGGMSTAGLIPCFCQFSDGVNFLAGGIGREIYESVLKLGSSGTDNTADNPTKELCIKPEILKRIYDDIMLTAGVDFTFVTNVISVFSSNRNVEYVICAAKSGIYAVKAKMYIDCTGDGDLAALAGAAFEKGDQNGNLQPGTLCSTWTNIDWDTVKKNQKTHERNLLPQAFKDEIFTTKDPHLPGFWKIGENIGGANIGHTFDLDATDEKSITKALLWARKILPEYKEFYKKYVHGYKKMELVTTASLLGVRETRRIICDYILSFEDYKNRSIFEDEIGRYAYPIDLHPSSIERQSYQQFEDDFHNLKYNHGESYGIPFRILTPKDFDNMLIAGRCVSSDRFVNGSIRVIPACFITGQASGMAAAIAIDNKNYNVRNIDVKAIQQKLCSIGAYLPNFKN
jgi:hypothetical protein